MAWSGGEGLGTFASKKRKPSPSISSRRIFICRSKSLRSSKLEDSFSFSTRVSNWFANSWNRSEGLGMKRKY